MDLTNAEMLALINQYEETLTEIQEGQILKGTVVEVRENEVLLNIGFKSEGVIPLDEFGGADRQARATSSTSSSRRSRTRTGWSCSPRSAPTS